MLQPSCAPGDEDGRAGTPDTPWGGLALPPRIGDRFTLDELIGRGPCSEVWSATDTLLDRPATVKIFAVTGDHRAGMRVLAGLDHPHLVPVYDVGDITDTDGARAYVVTTPMIGSLADRFADGPLDLVDSLVVGASVADALDHVHRAGVVHGAVTPTNVLFDGDGRAHLSDVGVALVSDSPHVSDTGFTVGAAPYLAPEQVRGDAVGPPADLYALGLVLLETLTGRPAYPGAPLDAARARLDTAPAVPADLPAPVAALLHRLTDADPAARPRADEVTVGLRRAALASEPEPEPDRPVVPLPRGAAPVVGPRGLLVAGGLALSVLLAGTVVLASTRPVDEVVSATIPPSAAAVPSILAAPSTSAEPPSADASYRGSSGSSGASSSVDSRAEDVSAPAGGEAGGPAHVEYASGPGAPTVARPPTSRQPSRSTSTTSSSASSSGPGDRPSDTSRHRDRDHGPSREDRGPDGDTHRSHPDGNSSDRHIQALPRVVALLDGLAGGD